MAASLSKVPGQVTKTTTSARWNPKIGKLTVLAVCLHFLAVGFHLAVLLDRISHAYRYASRYLKEDSTLIGPSWWDPWSLSTSILTGHVGSTVCSLEMFHPFDTLEGSAGRHHSNARVLPVIVLMDIIAVALIGNGYAWQSLWMTSGNQITCAILGIVFLLALIVVTFEIVIQQKEELARIGGCTNGDDVNETDQEKQEEVVPETEPQDPLSIL